LVPPPESLHLPVDRCVVRQHAAVERTPLGRPAFRWVGVQSAHEDMIDPDGRRPGEAPVRSFQARERTRVPDAEIEVAAEDHGLGGACETVGEDRGAKQLGIRETLVRRTGGVEVADDERRVSTSDTHDLADTTLLSPGPTGGRTESQVSRVCSAKPERIEDEVPPLEHAQVRSEED